MNKKLTGRELDRLNKFIFKKNNQLYKDCSHFAALTETQNCVIVNNVENKTDISVHESKFMIEETMSNIAFLMDKLKLIKDEYSKINERLEMEENC